MAPAADAGGMRSAHGRRRHERHKEFNARATRDRPRGAGTGCPPAQRRVNPRSNQRRFPPPRRAPGAFASRPPAPGANRRRAWRGVARRRGDGRVLYDGSAVHSLPVRPCQMRYACVVLQFVASVSQSRRSAHSAPVVKLAVAIGMENFQWTSRD
jgi:hypothetical protein